MEVQEGEQWYVQSGTRVQGPWSTQEIGRYLLLGSIHTTDRVSLDGELWEPVTLVPQLIPEELLDLDGDLSWTSYINSTLGNQSGKSEDDGVRWRVRKGLAIEAHCTPQYVVREIHAGRLGLNDAISREPAGVWILVSKVSNFRKECWSVIREKRSRRNWRDILLYMNFGLIFFVFIVFVLVWLLLF